MSDHRWTFIGLGNPGQKYETTRHNLGFMTLQLFAHKNHWRFKEEKRLLSAIAKGNIHNCELTLMLPLTYMNESGVAVKRYVDFYRYSLDRLVVITDDVALPFGSIRLKMHGGPGGHNGLKSIENYLGTDHYVRVRMGVGRKDEKMTLADYVLSNFSIDEYKELPTFLCQGVAVLEALCNEPIESVMNRLNTKVKLQTLPEGQEKTS